MTTVFIISAPSGSGKSTLVGELMKRVPDLYFSVSYTTRPPRGQERDGNEYHFISRPNSSSGWPTTSFWNRPRCLATITGPI